MKKTLVFLLTTSLLVSCSLTEQESVEEKLNEENEKTEEQAKTEETETEKLIRELPESAELDAWNLVLVNPQEALDPNFSPDLIEVENEQKIDRRIVEAWTSLKESANEAGHQLFLASAYRDISRQESNFNQKVNNYLDDGLSEEEARIKVKEYLTEPGHSEHHTGLALDIVDEEWIVAGKGLEPEYENEASQQWLVENMADYGFILRYPKKKEELTEIQYEPWHFRYVGPEHAHFMEEHDLVLEEYIVLIEKSKE